MLTDRKHVSTALVVAALLSTAGCSSGGSRSGDWEPTSSNSSTPRERHPCSRCGTSGTVESTSQMKVQDAWGTDENGNLIDEWHYETRETTRTCPGCGGSGYR